jgi:NAD(P)-dependent dehydrogenase (short-subunit alcohol dehydrogenase family)
MGCAQRSAGGNRQGLISIERLVIERSRARGSCVRVNCVSPGWIMTGDYASLRRKDHTQHPVGRVGKPQDIAEMVASLLDGEHSGFTCANFTVDGGMTRKMIYEE